MEISPFGRNDGNKEYDPETLAALFSVPADDPTTPYHLFSGIQEKK